jgi:hypothetical protein
MAHCAEYARLASHVEDVLARLADLTSQQLKLFRDGDFPASRRLDRELETTIGNKERAIGALRQHMIERRCQSREPI